MIDHPTTRLARHDCHPNWSGAHDYDLVVVGGGMSGLSTALLHRLHAPDRSVLLLEKNAYPGGYVTAFGRHGYVFETSQLLPDVGSLLDHMGVSIPVRTWEGACLRKVVIGPRGRLDWRLPSGVDAFTQALVTAFPAEASRVQRLMAYAVRLFDETQRLKANPRPWEALATPFVAPRLIVSLSRTFAGLMDRFGLKDPDLRDVLSTFAAFAGVPASRASAIMTVGAMMASIRRSARPLGLFDELPAGMMRRFQALGGEVRLKARVERIEVKPGRVSGVVVRGDAGAIRARNVVVTVDPVLAMTHLLDPGHLPARYRRRVDALVMSPSAVTVSLGLDDALDLAALDLDYPYVALTTGPGTEERLWDAFRRGVPGFQDDCFAVSVSAPTLTTGVPPTLTLSALGFPPGDWTRWRAEDPDRYAAAEAEWADRLVGWVQAHLVPDLASHVVLRDVATPATYARYSGSPTGSHYDIAAIPSQFGPYRLPTRTPVPGLWMPKFSHGIYGALMNGVQMADLLLDRRVNGGRALFR